MFVLAGERDTLIPVEEARRFVARLKEVSNETVLYAEMKGGQHAFDLLPSWRSLPAIEAVERFLTTVHNRAAKRELVA
jgi:acetyl esterase/lipase